MVKEGKQPPKKEIRTVPEHFEREKEGAFQRLSIRQAKPQEAQLLTSIARMAKAYWGYPPEWLQHWQGELSVLPQYIERHWVYAAVDARRVAGFYALVNHLHYASLEHLWVKPDFIGKGVGRALFEHACRLTLSQKIPVIEIVADPNAEGFYRRMGAVKYKDISYRLFGTERVLPVFRLNLDTISGEP